MDADLICFLRGELLGMRFLRHIRPVPDWRHAPAGISSSGRDDDASMCLPL